MLTEVLGRIERLQENIFQNDTQEFQREVLLFVEELGELVQQKDLEADLQPILAILLQVYERQDYQLFADMLEFELAPLIRSSKESVVGK